MRPFPDCQFYIFAAIFRLAHCGRCNFICHAIDVYFMKYYAHQFKYNQISICFVTLIREWRRWREASILASRGQSIALFSPLPLKRALIRYLLPLMKAAYSAYAEIAAFVGNCYLSGRMRRGRCAGRLSGGDEGVRDACEMSDAASDAPSNRADDDAKCRDGETLAEHRQMAGSSNQHHRPVTLLLRRRHHHAPHFIFASASVQMPRG